jgi:hypothetical protein
MPLREDEMIVVRVLGIVKIVSNSKAPGSGRCLEPC